MKYCVIIPTYNNDQTLERVITDVLKITKDVIVVNDGSTDNTQQIIEKFESVKKISYPVNKGKGYAIRKGFNYAISEGFDYAITIDSDGQHYPGDIPVFTEKIIQEPGSLIVGSRNLSQENISKGSSFANRFSNFWFRFVTGINLSDTQTGFRLYPLDFIRNTRFTTRKYEFELEILVKAAWKKINLISVPVRVFYPPKDKRISHFRPFKDFARISILNTLLVIIALLYIKPFSFIRYLNRDTIREFIRKHILLAEASNLNIALSVSLGVFMGIVPIWGFQLITAIALAHLFKLSKFVVSVAANISIPPMIPVILYLSYVSGGWILGYNSNIKFSRDLSIHAFKNDLLQYIVGSFAFAAVFAVLVLIVSFIILELTRKRTDFSR
jgi:glycosyltransferase involved in cell wall biosynthesis